MAEVARRPSSRPDTGSRSYTPSPQKNRNQRSPLQSSSTKASSTFDDDHQRPVLLGPPSAHKRSVSSDPSSSAYPTSLPSTPSKADRKKLAKEILASGSDQLRATLKQRGMLHALLSDPVRFVKSHQKQGQDYTTLGLTPINDPNYAALQKRKQEQKQHALLLHTDSSKINGNTDNVSIPVLTTQMDPSSPSKTAKAKSASLDLYPYKISLRFPGKVRSAATGLSNYGNTCYMNSVMQSLIHTPPLAFALLTQDPDVLHGEWGGRPNANFDAVTAMQNFAKRSLQGSRPTNAPQEFNRNLKAFAKPLRQGRQEDAHEYLRFLLEALQQSCLARAPKSLKPDDPTRCTTFVQKTFGGKLRSRVTCHSCGYNSDTFDPFMDLSLDVRKGINSLTDAFRAFVAKDHLTGSEKYKCNQCKRKVDATKQFTIESAPPALTIHLKRFTVFGGKISRQVAFDETLNIATYLSVNRGPAKYRLYAAVHHYGSGPNSGHYVASVKSPSGKWTRMDDSHVSEMGRSGPVNDQSAYILFYLREKDEALEKAIAASVPSPRQLSTTGFSKSTTDAHLQSYQKLAGKLDRKRKEAPALSQTSEEETSESSEADSQSEEEQLQTASASSAVKKHAKLTASSRSPELPKAASAASTLSQKSSAPANGRSLEHRNSEDESQSDDEDSNANGRSNPRDSRAMVGSSHKLDRKLSSEPTSAASFYGSSGLKRGSNAFNPFSMPAAGADEAEELGTTLDRGEYESLIGRSSLSPTKASMNGAVGASAHHDPEVDSDDADFDLGRLSASVPLSKKEKRKQKKASQAIQAAKDERGRGRGIPVSPCAAAFTSGSGSAKEQKKRKAKKNKLASLPAAAGGLAGRMKPRPSL